MNTQPTVEKRTYRSPIRSEQAAGTRQRILAAARSCFTESGWSGTTLAQIAKRAGVSPQAVHLSVGAKPALLMYAIGDAIGGSAAQRPDFERALFAEALRPGTTPAERARAFATAIDEIHQRAGALFEVLAHAAQTDPELGDQRAAIKARRLELVRGLVRASGRRRGAAFERLVDLVYALSSTSLHQEFVSRGWSGEAYRSWLGDELTRLLEQR